MQGTYRIGYAQGVNTNFILAVGSVFKKQERRIEENLLCFHHGHAMLIVLPLVSRIPFKTGYLGEV